jgi:hypothetical protein
MISIKRTGNARQSFPSGPGRQGEIELMSNYARELIPSRPDARILIFIKLQVDNYSWKSVHEQNADAVHQLNADAVHQLNADAVHQQNVDAVHQQNADAVSQLNADVVQMMINDHFDHTMVRKKADGFHHNRHHSVCHQFTFSTD